MACVTATVTQSQYDAFLKATAESPPKQAPECAWNTGLAPPVLPPGGEDVSDNSCPPGVYDPEHLPDNSAVCVDWCDAKAYCEWAGKRLCGPLPGRPVTAEVRDAFAETEWRYACTNGGLRDYPYGDRYIAGKCVDEAFARAKMGSLGSRACTGSTPPYSAIQDLAGSVYEWTSLCQRMSCSIEGGSLGSDAPSCTSAGRTTPRARISSSIGFRCCADAKE